MKEKIKNHIKKHKIIYSALLILFCFSGLILSFNKIEITDELFTFANTYKLHNGVSLYSENNVIDTPLFFYIGNIFLSVLGANFFVYKIYGIVIFEVIFLISRRFSVKLYVKISSEKYERGVFMLSIYKIYGIVIFEVIFLISLNILRKLKVPTGRAVVYILLILLPFTKTLFVNGANYSTLALLFWLLGMNFVIKKDKFEVKPIQQGIISALVFATKQNIGVYYLIAITLFTIYNYRKERKTILKKLVSTYIIFALITAIWCIILALQGQFIDFINYCVLGIGEFAKNHFDFQDWRIILLIGYPIFNAYHIELAMVVSMVYCMYMAEQVIVYTKEIFLVKPVKIVIIGYIGFVLLINAFYMGSTIIKGSYKTDYDNPYFGMLATEEMKNKINEIVNFVELKEEKNQKVIIFSEEANIYQIVLGKNYQDLDLPLLGNWGYNGEERVLNKIMGLRDSFILIKDTSRTNQESEKIKQYIKNNYNRTGEIQGFEIYYIE